MAAAPPITTPAKAATPAFGTTISEQTAPTVPAIQPTRGGTRWSSVIEAKTSAATAGHRNDDSPADHTATMPAPTPSTVARQRRLGRLSTAVNGMIGQTQVDAVGVTSVNDATIASSAPSTATAYATARSIRGSRSRCQTVTPPVWATRDRRVVGAGRSRYPGTGRRAGRHRGRFSPGAASATLPA